MTSANDDRAALRILVAAAVAIIEKISKALPGFFNTLVAKFLPNLAKNLHQFLKKLPNVSVGIVLSLTIIKIFYFA